LFARDAQDHSAAVTPRVRSCDLIRTKRTIGGSDRGPYRLEPAIRRRDLISALIDPIGGDGGDGDERSSRPMSCDLDQASSPAMISAVIVCNHRDMAQSDVSQLSHSTRRASRAALQRAALLLAACAILAGCGERDCSLEALADDFVGTTEYVDCGHFQTDRNDEAAYGVAHDCVVAQIAERRSFVVRWYLQGIEGVDRHAYAGLARDRDYDLTELVQGYNVDATVRPTMIYECSGLIDKGNCASFAADLCLDCVIVNDTTCEP
jgi:hypothetical protein